MGEKLEVRMVSYVLGLFVSSMLAIWTVKFLIRAWFRPRQLERVLRAQGIRGTSYQFPLGDIREAMHLQKEAQSKPMNLSHDIAPRLDPMIHYAIKKYGRISFYWFGPDLRVILMEPELVKEVLSNKFAIKKPAGPSIIKLYAQGVATYEGQKWATHRRIINTAFQLEKLKIMLPTFLACCDDLVQKWSDLLGSGESCELDIQPEFQKFTGDAISRTAFSSNYEQGQRIFELQKEQARLLVDIIKCTHIPGYGFLPTKKNRRMKEIYREMNSILRNMIEQREQAMRKGQQRSNDLLGLLMESNMQSDSSNSEECKLTIEDVVEECKLFYIAGHETTSLLLTWTLVVLSMHPMWQVRARDEVLEILGEVKPSFDSLSKLKIVTMIFYEVLRLYPSLVFMIRETYKTLKLGDFTFPAGVQFVLPVLDMHHSPDYWGPDVNEFNPIRFSEGVTKASKVPLVFFPFGGGPRICPGQNFAMIEAKACLARILQHFSFELSPSYAHAPHTLLHPNPKFGAQLIIRRI
ncbi:Cytochrome P450 [Rhynchospora pubera]|uniref:Cytochrome P450 n=1 Tax=Rhynchospora pubera TaxID=906938 RepID=A0AAV8GLW5_9POAL|nr:Cytochrome P450 [Rhynchospora pubera]